MASILCTRLAALSPTTPTSTLDSKHNFAGHLNDFTTWVPRTTPGRSSRLKSIRAQKFNIWELLGGRGLGGGEMRVQQLNNEIPLPNVSEKTQNSPTSTGMVSVPNPSDANGFEKELDGLTGGFPGGEKGLLNFIRENPTHPKDVVADVGNASELQKRLPRPETPSLPLFMPGMIVIVKNPNNPYHMFCGTVQRVTDGKVGVLFEGGNWDKLVTFKLQDLERRSKGPPMSHPKSAILEDMTIP